MHTNEVSIFLGFFLFLFHSLVEIASFSFLTVLSSTAGSAEHAVMKSKCQYLLGTWIPRRQGSCDATLPVLILNSFESFSYTSLK